MYRPSRESVGKKCQRYEDDRPDKRRHANPEVKEEANAKIKQHPRQIEERRRTVST